MYSQQSSTSSTKTPFRCRSYFAYLPAADTEKEAQHIRLLLLLELFDVFEGTHLREIVLAQLFDQLVLRKEVFPFPVRI